MPDALEGEQPFAVHLVEVGLVPDPQADLEVGGSGDDVDLLDLGYAELAQHLLAAYGARLLVVGRRTLDDDEAEAAWGRPQDAVFPELPASTIGGGKGRGGHVSVGGRVSGLGSGKPS
ncbi:hypothetical protein GCM10011578_081010 [Streptomyces fuscichromogenes]|uniref:Uncharacterized protein n=1 Tax=Streptomyces fuscichromogenes TaxID=1324013 RepID=A0A917XLI5_9ACTN|nr:hypothetical protein [Streptomyces fuscichromogenes]GGN37089.1 hypothetical protein GCM10011578_081010 [Streptomyces fuscichromogenes]